MGRGEYIIKYTDQFINDIEKHKIAGNRSILNKIDALIDELRIHPATGIGKPELLRGNRRGQWSRRISRKHRLIYEIREDIVVIILLTAWGHYDDK